jgi:hypothetical protein
MKSTLYTNCMLTVIAISLLYLCVAHVVQPPAARAAAEYSVPTVRGDNDVTAVPVVVYSFQPKTQGLGSLLLPKP